MMKIAIVGISIGGVMGDLFQTVTNSLSIRHKVLAITNKSMEEQNLDASKVLSFRFNRHKPLDFINPYKYWKIYRSIKKFNPDVVLFLTPHYLNSVVYMMVPKRTAIRFKHDDEPHSGDTRPGILSIADKIFDPIFERCPNVIVSSYWMKKRLIDKQYHISADRIWVNYLGTLTNLKPIVGNNQIREDIDVIFFGRVEYYKGVDILIESAKALPHLTFYIIGKGDIAACYGIHSLPSNCVRLDEYVPNEKLCLLIQRSKIVVLPYRDATGSQVIPTAFAFSKPVVATNVGCFAEYVTNKEDGLIVPSNNPQQLATAIESLVIDDNKRIAMGINGYKKAQTTFSEEAIATKYEMIFNELIGWN